jgi:XTP/dITP diphosphohydrolase
VEALFKPSGLSVLFAPDISSSFDVDETGGSYASNALLKAKAWGLRMGMAALADDSGLEVSALENAPGIYSSRVAASDPLRIRWLLDAMKAVSDRSARYVAAFALSVPGEEVCIVTEGECRGCIAEEPRGEGGFGYDPVFIPCGYDKTFGELPADVKRALSHRTIAGYRMMDILSRKSMLE